MEIHIHIREAFVNLKGAKMRSFLAILGVVVGTGSVVALITSSQLATDHALSQFKTLGTNLLSMSIQQSPNAPHTKQHNNLTLDKMPQLYQADPQIRLVAPFINTYKQMNYRGDPIFGQIIGAYSPFASIAKLQLKTGRFVSEFDADNLYCVIGSSVAELIAKKGRNPLGEQIQVGDNFFTVIGTLKYWPQNLFIYSDINNSIIIPLTVSYFLDPKSAIGEVLFRLVKNPNLIYAQNNLKYRMGQILPTAEVQFRNPQEIIDIVAKQRKTFTILLASIGGISLLVGGIGVMNIMLVSVVERRREIGIRMAIGAQPSDIRRMFLIESIILTLFGGIVGVLLGVASSFLIVEITGWGFHLYLMPPLLGFVVSVLVGLFSGIYPAMRASKLDPIKTLTEV